MSKILVAEDIDMNYEIISRMLKINGFDVTRATNGKEAVEQAILQKPDVILMDMGMPIMNGWEATQMIKENDTLAHIPIIALTAHTLRTEVDKAMNSGCNDYETKPIMDWKNLIEKINKQLHNKSNE